MTGRSASEDHREAPAVPAAITGDKLIPCGELIFYCRCDLPRGHDGPHVCDLDGLTWSTGEDGDKHVIALADPFKRFSTEGP